MLLQDDRFHITFTKAKKGTDFVLLIQKDRIWKDDTSERNSDKRYRENLFADSGK